MLTLFQSLVGRFAVCLFCSLFAQGIVAQTPENDLLLALSCLKKAQLLNDSAKYANALLPARQAYDGLLAIVGAADKRTATAAFTLGVALNRQRKPKDQQARQKISADAIQLLKASISTWSALYPEGNQQTADALFELGTVFQNEENLKEALDAHQQCFAIRRIQLPANDLLVAASFLQIGEVLFARGMQTEAIHYLEESLRIHCEIEGSESQPAVMERSNLARAFLYLGDVERAIALSEQALSTQQRVLSPLHSNFTFTCYTLGMCFNKLYRYDDALFYFNKIVEVNKKKYPNKLSPLIGVYSEIGKVYLEKKDFQKAQEYFDICNNYVIETKETESLGYAYTCHDMGRLYMALKNYDTAAEWYKKNIAILRKVYQTDNEEIALLLTELGNIASAQGSHLEALELFKNASLIFFNNLGADNSTQYLPESGMGNTYRAMYIQTKDQQYLEQSRGHFKAAAQSIDRLIRLERSSLMRKKWLTDTKKVFEQAIATEMLYDQKSLDPSAREKAWQLSETMHGFDLFAASQEVHARQFSSIPTNLLEQEQGVRIAIANIQKQRQALVEGAHLPLTDPLVLENNVQYFALKTAYTKLIAQFESEYPDYYHLKHDLNNISISAIQQMLNSDQTLLEYFVGEQTIYIFAIRSTDSHVVAVPRDFPLTDWIAQMREYILFPRNSDKKSPALYEQSVREYATLAQHLFQKLIAPVNEFLSPQMIIIPDGEINYIPFEALLSDVPKDVSNFKTYPFLVKKHAFSYAYSATTLAQMIHKQHREEPTGSLLAFAPFYRGDTTQIADQIEREVGNRSGFQPLPYTGEEILRAKKQMGSNSPVWMGASATLEQFKELAATYRILHLATHGRANERTGEASFIAFHSDADTLGSGLLYVQDLYNLTLNADLVVLSACETGIGQLHQGEGVVSLARAFSFAGAKSVVTSLWSVNDQSSMRLMDLFYRELKVGTQKNNALATAKRNYLQKYPGLQSHPFYWAGFVALGDWSALK